MTLDPKDSITYPVRVTHRGHLAFRMRSTDSTEVEDVIMPDGNHPNPAALMRCGTCNTPLTPIGVVSGSWKVDNKI